MQLESAFWQNPDSLRHIYVRADNGAQIPLQLARWRRPVDRKPPTMIEQAQRGDGHKQAEKK